MPIENLQNKNTEELEQLLKEVTTTRILKESEYEERSREAAKLKEISLEKTGTSTNPETSTQIIQKNTKEEDNTILFTALLTKLEEDRKDKEDLLFYKTHLKNLRKQESKEGVVTTESQITEMVNQEKEETSESILQQMKQKQKEYDDTKPWKISMLKEIRRKIDELQQSYDKKVLEEKYNREHTK